MATQAEGAPKAYDAVKDPKPEAIVVYCSDPRFQGAFDQFIANDLKLAKGQYVPLVVGGGAGVLAHPERLPKEFKFMKERFELYSELHDSLRRVVLISHEDCKYYVSLKERVRRLLGGEGQDVDHARADMAMVQEVFGRLLSHLGLTVELYHAHFADPAHAQIVFERIKV